MAYYSAYYSTEGRCTVTGSPEFCLGPVLNVVLRGLSNTVDQNPVVSLCFPSENRKSSGVKSVLVSVGCPLDTNRFEWKSSFSVRETLRKLSLMLDEWVESRSDGVHRIHWERIDSDGKEHFLFVRDGEKFASNDEGNPLFVTGLMEKSLRALLAQRQLTETERRVISLDVARAINYLHQKKPKPIIHRDVSSANVLLWQQGDQWRGKVSDYGTANFMQQTMTVAPGAMIYSATEALT